MAWHHLRGAANVFDDPYAYSSRGMILLLVAHTVREEGQDEVIHLIPARQADRKERKRYEQNRSQDFG
jgi:uncharacterized DUF497 family protein